MATTGTYSFAPSAADIVLNAFAMIGVKRTEIDQEKLQNAYMAFNLLMVDVTNRAPNRWTMETTPVTLTALTPTYSLDPQILSIAIAYIAQTDLNGTTTSRVIGPISATDYAAIPNKLNPGPPTSYFFSLLTPNPTVTVWPVVSASDSTVYTLQLQTFRQLQDVSLSNGQTIDAPYRFLDAFSVGLAARLFLMYPEKSPAVNWDDLYEKRFKLAAEADQEKTPMYVRPIMGAYFR